MTKFDEKSCGVVVFREQENEKYFLILKYPGGHFDLVKGHIEANETEIQTATRELLEETGIADLKYIYGFREEISYKYFRNNGLPSNKQVVFFLGKTNLSDIRLSHEHHEFFWLKYNDALEKLTFDNAKNLLVKAKEFLKK